MHYHCGLAMALALVIPGVVLGTVYAGLNYTLVHTHALTHSRLTSHSEVLALS